MITHEFAARIKRVNSTDVDTPVNVTLSYDAGTDPFAVQAIFQVSEEEDRVWHFSRELLRIGARSLVPYGKGDVKFRYFPLHSAILMCLRTAGYRVRPGEASHADIALPADEVGTFLEMTNEAAQVTPEECDALVDEFLKELFEA
jgi:hypothetical protein